MSFDLPNVQDAIIAISTIAGVAVLFALAFISVSAVLSRGSRRTGKLAPVNADFAHPVATDRTPEFAHPVATDRTPELVSR